MSVKDSQDFVERSFFKPYDTVSSSGEKTVEAHTEFDAKQFWKDLGTVAANDAYDIACATTEKDLQDVFEGLFSFFITLSDEDAYLFSSAMGKYRIKNEELYVITDWTNEDVTYMDITEGKLSEVVCKPYNSEDLPNGASVNNYGVNTLNAYLHKYGPADKTFHLSQMDDKYEYRVVVRGDFNYGVTSHYYRHGLLSSLVTMDWKTFKGGFTETVEEADITELENLRIYIEYREKQ